MYCGVWNTKYRSIIALVAEPRNSLSARSMNVAM
jgi:hypothetical protein